MSEGMSHREILDRAERQHGHGYLHNKYDKKKHAVAKKMVPESARLRNAAMNKKYGIPKSTRHDEYLDTHPREHYNK